MNKILLISTLGFFGNSAFGALVIQNNFNGVADDIGPAFQGFSNGVGGGTPADFDVTTGLVDNVGSTTNATGFNNVSLVTIPVGTTEFTATFVVDSAANMAAVQSNGLFLGIVTGTDATETGGTALFNNDPGAFGLNLFQGLTNSRIIQDGVDSGANTVVQALTSPTDPSVEDGFTFTLTLRNDNTFDASTTGLSTDVSIVNATLNTGNPTFSDFVSGGIGLNGSVQGNNAMFTIGSAQLDVVPEPSTSVIVGMLSGMALFSRRRSKT